MTTFQKVSLVLARISMGTLFFYAGITKIFAQNWTAAGYLQGAKTFPELYQWLLQPTILPIVNFLNEWGLTLLGASLLLGIFVRLSSAAGILLMILYYLPILQFPYPNPHAFIVDEHIVYSSVLLVLAAFGAGRVWGLETWCANLPVCRKIPLLRHLIG